MCEFTRLRDLAVVVRRQAIPEVVSAVMAGTIDLDEAYRISQCDDQLSEMHRESAPLSLLDRFREIWDSASPADRAAIGQIVGVKAESSKAAGVLFPDAAPAVKQKERVKPTDEEFEAFYSAFPRRVNKAKAKVAFRTAFGRLRKKMDCQTAITTIMEGVRVYAENANPDALCHPTTWLNGDRWEDDPSGIGTQDRASRNSDNAMLGAYVERERTPISEAVF
jgi:hypothetical protein